MWPSEDMYANKEVESNLYTMSFMNLKSMNEALTKSPWTVMGCCLSLKKWELGLTIQEICFQKMKAAPIKTKKRDSFFESKRVRMGSFENRVDENTGGCLGERSSKESEDIGLGNDVGLECGKEWHEYVKVFEGSVNIEKQEEDNVGRCVISEIFKGFGKMFDRGDKNKFTREKVKGVDISSGTKHGGEKENINPNSSGELRANQGEDSRLRDYGDVVGRMCRGGKIVAEWVYDEGIDEKKDKFGDKQKKYFGECPP
ncbi:hypothetical protein PTKIN_Ptkin12aG0108200 [Pterospermum kingtungense]